MIGQRAAGWLLTCSCRVCLDGYRWVLTRIGEQVEIIYEAYTECPADRLEPGVEVEDSAELFYPTAVRRERSTDEDGFAGAGMQCPVNSMYTVTASGCPITCTTPSAPVECKAPPSEGCVCNPGYLLSQDRCVPLAQCGCQYKGQYFMSGEEFYADSDCQQHCVCHGGVVHCKDKPCERGQSCGVQEGVRGCYASLKKE